MKIHTFIDGCKPVMVLIHGVLTPWQIWTYQIEQFSKDYNVYAVALDAHTQQEASEFISVSAEAEAIAEYFISQGIDTIDALCGISLGGKIAFEVAKDGRLKIKHLVLDGAPIVKCPSVAVGVMVNNYKRIIAGSKRRDKKTIENFKKYFLPEKYLDEYLQIADKMTDASMENIVRSAFCGGGFSSISDKCKILFIHGTRGNELLSKRSARLLKKHYPKTAVVCFKGDAHCYKAIYQPDVWVKTVRDFLNT